MAGQDIEKLVKLVAKLPSLGTRSARRIVLQLLKKKETLFLPLIEAMQNVAENIKTCEICGNYDTTSPCSVCASMERVSFFKGRYHVLGGILSAIDGITPEDLNIEAMLKRIDAESIREIILALPATVDGQITANYINSRLKDRQIKVSTLAQGIPMGAELDYMDEGTIQLALNARKLL